MWQFLPSDRSVQETEQAQLVPQSVLPSASADGSPSDGYFRAVLEALPAAVYITDDAGVITYYNEAAATLWGHRPELGEAQWCGSWKLYRPDGSPLPHDQCPMAKALRDGKPNSGMEAIAERPDGVRVPFIPYPTPLYDASGALVGAVNMLIDITDRKRAEESAQRLAAIVASSDDAIVSKDLNGVITSWNRGAERLFGYTADEVIGKSITIIIPPERHDEEPKILAQIRSGLPVEHYETVRRRKDGSLVDVSLTASPVKNAAGRVIGASKIARDISDRKRAQDQQRLLLREMNHRVRNLFALASSVVTLSARFADSAQDLAKAVCDRLIALSRAHDLTLSNVSVEAHADKATTLHDLVRTIVSPYENPQVHADQRFVLKGPDVPIGGAAVTAFALLLHEFATNATKYGALSTPAGHVDVGWSVEQDKLLLTWQERGGPRIDGQPQDEGFGSVVVRATVQGQLNAQLTRGWEPDGLIVRLLVPVERLT